MGWLYHLFSFFNIFFGFYLIFCINYGPIIPCLVLSCQQYDVGTLLYAIFTSHNRGVGYFRPMFLLG